MADLYSNTQFNLNQQLLVPSLLLFYLLPFYIPKIQPCPPTQLCKSISIQDIGATDLILLISSSLYRRSLKLALDWAVHRQIWRGQAVYIRSLFEANKDVRDPRQQKVGVPHGMQTFCAFGLRTVWQVLLRETEKLLDTWKHPDPYRMPTAPGGM